MNSQGSIPDREMVDIANYVLNYSPTSEEAYDTASLCLMDSLGCAILALKFPECTKMLGPLVEGTIVPGGSHVPGTSFVLDPVRAAFDISVMIRWLDFNDTWLAAEWGHPSDNLGSILSVSEYISRKNIAGGTEPMTMRDVFTAMIKAYEIQGVMAMENSFNRRGLDHVILVKLASAAVSAGLLGCDEEQIVNAISQVWADLGPLRVYRHAPNTGSRKSWAAGDAASRGVFLAMLSARGENGYPTVLTAPIWGFYDRSWSGERFMFPVPYGCYIIENILFKTHPAEFHGQTAVEAAISLHPEVRDRLDKIEGVEIITQEAAMRIIDKKGDLKSPADRDHCLQYMTAIGLIFGKLEYEDYGDARASDPGIDALREKIRVRENSRYTRDYYDPEKRSIPNLVQVFFNDGSSTRAVEIEFPQGHRRRRAEAIPVLEEKFRRNLSTRFQAKRVKEITQLFSDRKRLEQMPVHLFMELLAMT
ncbi:MAG TPA: bifunctional 2-methylcitrate dehydratase/aconitate hydratase [Candidatus Methanoperedens sp.]|nr:bifunctional 2-methylcitrate dehydratase/aconitate hydratase [Candidatus Methanoperedens sp.]HLB71049.1 bifunctional 2-methylcitrate dehydratase/aconitate hydratase [Candidatus Methanoperedens sp.]